MDDSGFQLSAYMAGWANFPVARGALAVRKWFSCLRGRRNRSGSPWTTPPVAWPRACYETGALPLLIAWPGKTPSTTAPSRTTGVPPTSTNLNPREGLAGAS